MWKSWLKGLGAAAIGGVSMPATAYLGQWAQATMTAATTPGAVPPKLSGGLLGALALGGGVLGAIGYLMKSPLQPPPAPPAQ